MSGRTDIKKSNQKTFQSFFPQESNIMYKEKSSYLLTAIFLKEKCNKFKGV